MSSISTRLQRSWVTGTTEIVGRIKSLRSPTVWIGIIGIMFFLMGHAWPDISGHFQNFGMIHPLLRRYLWCDSWFSEGARLSLHLSGHRLRPRCRLVEWSRYRLWMHEMFGVLYMWCTYFCGVYIYIHIYIHIYIYTNKFDVFYGLGEVFGRGQVVKTCINIKKHN